MPLVLVLFILMAGCLIFIVSIETNPGFAFFVMFVAAICGIWLLIYACMPWKIKDGGKIYKVQTLTGGNQIIETDTGVINVNAIFEKKFNDGDKIQEKIYSEGPYFGIYDSRTNIKKDYEIVK